MDKKYITRRVKAKLNLKKKIKNLKNKLIKKKYKSLNLENAVAYTRDLSKEHYWGFDVADKPKTSERTSQGVKVIDVKIENSRDSFGDVITVWFDPILGKLHGDYKNIITQHAKHKPEFQFKLLNEDNATDYANSIEGLKVDTNRKIKKTKQDDTLILEIPIIVDGDSNQGHSLAVWYDPGYMGLYGEW